MHDLRALRADPNAFDAALARRGLPACSAAILDQDQTRRSALTQMQDHQTRRKALAREIAEHRKQGLDTARLEREAVVLRDELVALEARANALESAIASQLAELPNLLDPSVPPGSDEHENAVIKQWGEPKTFSFTPKQHFDLGESLGLMDFPLAAKLSGARFTVLRGALARLERALGQFMLDIHVALHGYTELNVPVLVKEEAMYGADKLPKFAADSFRTEDGRWLIPTAEVPLVAGCAGEIFDEKRLPLRWVALSPSFRSEAGSAGRDVRGMLRQHQFNKVELVSITTPGESANEHERMTRAAETILEKLNLPYRRILLCAGDTGFGAEKTYDLEGWLPGQNAWREISSCSTTGAFQARRMQARYRSARGVEFVHTLNGSGLAVGRTLIAVMENYQTESGEINVPDVLRPYMGNVSCISPVV